MSDRPGWADRLGGRATSTSQPPSRPEPARSNGPEPTSLAGPGPKARPAVPGPEGPALRVVLVSRDKMLAGALRSLIEAPGGVRMLDWYSEELDNVIRHADVVIVDMPPTLHKRTFAVLDGRFLGRTVVLLQEGERAEALPPGAPRAVLYRPLQIGELWSAVTGAADPSVEEAATEGAAVGPDAGLEPEVGPEAEPEVVEPEGGEPPPQPELEPDPEPEPGPGPGLDVQPEPEAGGGDLTPVDGVEDEAGAAAAVPVEGLGLPVSESGRLIGLSGQELDPVIGPGEVAPGMDEATFERLRGWKTGPGARQPAGGRKAQGPGRARSDAGREAARRTKAAEAEARREQARQEKATRGEKRQAARSETGQQRTARADARTAAREESLQAQAAKAEARRIANEERQARAEEARQAKAARAGARLAAREEARQAKAARTQARAAARAEALQARAARAEERRAARAESRQAAAAEAESRRSARDEASQAEAAEAEARRAAREEERQTRAAEAKVRRAVHAEARKAKAESRRAARAEARQAAAAAAGARRAARSEERQAQAAEAEARRAARAEAHRTEAAEVQARQAEQAEAGRVAREEAQKAKAEQAEARRVAQEAARQAKTAQAEARRAAHEEAVRARAERRHASRQARSAKAEVRRAARAEAKEKRTAEAKVRREQALQAQTAKAEARAAARAEAAQQRAARAEARKAARNESRQAKAARAEERRTASTAATQARAAQAEARKAERAEAGAKRAAEAEVRRQQAQQENAAKAEAQAAQAEAQKAARDEARQTKAAEAEVQAAARREAEQARAAAQAAARQQADQAKAARAEARAAARAEAAQARAARAEERKAARQEAGQARAALAEERRAAKAIKAGTGAGAGTGTGAGAAGVVRPAVVALLVAVLGVAAAGWVGSRGAETRAGEVAVVRAAGGTEGGLVAQDPRVGPIAPLHALGVGVWLRVTEAGGSLEGVVQEARVPSRFLLAGVVGLTVVLFLLLMRVGPGSGAAAGPGPAPPQGGRALWRLGGAALAGALVALDPLLVESGRSATGTILAVLLAVGTVALAWGVPARPALRWLPLVAAGGGLALLVSPLALPVVAVPVVAELLQGRYRDAWKHMAALGLAIAMWLFLPVWVAGQELGAGQAGWLLGRPTGRGSVAASLSGAPLTWLLVAAGLTAAILTWRHRSGARSDGGPGAARLLAWTGTSVAGVLGAIALGYPAEQALPFAVPAAAVSLAIGAGLLVAAARTAQARRVALAGAGVLLAGLLAAQVVDWGGRYGGPADQGLGRLVATVRAQVPACSAVNASGPDDQARLVAAGVTVTEFSDGPAAHAAGVRYFVVTGATGQGGPMTPSLDAWVRQHGTRLAAHPSRSLSGVELWRVDAAPLDPVADLLPLPDGVFSNTTGSACGGYRVVDSQSGSFHTAYRSVGGKAVLGRPLGSVWTSDGPALQAFDTMVLGAVPTASGPPAVRPIELPPLLAKLDVEAVARADIPLPSVAPPVTNRQTRALLRDELIGRAYLGSDPATATDEDFQQASDRFGRPLGLPQMMPDGAIRQPFERAVLELPADGGPVRPAALGRLAVRLGLVPRQAMRLEPVPGLPARPAENRLDPAPLLWLVGGALVLLLLAAGAGAVLAWRSRAARAG